jgi:uncharacterized protein YcgI (DUF1989 family)
MTGLELIPARHGRAVRVGRGRTIEVVNTHGDQVLDTWAFNAADIAEHMSMEHTRSVNSRIYVKAGDVLYSNLRRPILRFLSDTSPGHHDILLCACNQAVYVELGCKDYHRNCEDNVLEALQALDLRPRAIPSPFNLFMNVRVSPEGDVLRNLPASLPGDAARLQAEQDLVIVFSSCPQDITPINGPGLTPKDAH